MRRPNWLARAGGRLPGLLRAEAGLGESWTRPSPAGQVALLAGAEAFGEGGAERLIGQLSDTSGIQTITGLRAGLRERFGVELPGIRLREAAMLPGEAQADLDGVPAGRVPGPAVDAEAEAWPTIAGAPAPLLALLRAALRNLDRFPPAQPAASLEEQTARSVMLADREPIDGAFAEAIGQAGDVLTGVAALRLRRAEQLWGASGRAAWLLLDPAVEAELARRAQAGSVALDEAMLVALIRSLQEAAQAGRVALVVRDPLLRPLVRALLRDDLPDVPVLAMAEVANQTVQPLVVVP